MNASKLARSLAFAFALAPIALTAGCAAEVVGEGTNQDAVEGQGGAGGGPTTSGGFGGSIGTGVGGTTYDAVALTWAQLDAYYTAEINTGSSGNTSAGPGGGPDPNKIFLQIANGGLTCSDPQTDDEPCNAALRWTVSIGLAAEQMTAGATYTLQELQAGVGLTGSNNTSDPNDCFGGGGSFWDGVVTIHNVDDAFVTFSLSGTNDGFEGILSDGLYVAPKCF